MINLKKHIKLIFPKSAIDFARCYIFDGYVLKSYSQEGEDMVLRRIFEKKTSGFYVDVGAHHPKRLSNTYFFYKIGWHGINIEPNPDLFNLFSKLRLRDINLNCGISSVRGELNYHMFDEPAYNTFDDKVLNKKILDASCKHIKTIRVNVITLADVMQQYVPAKSKVDFLSIDVEGFDLDVLKSNDWNMYRPNWVLVEQLNLTDVENLSFEIHIYMKSIGYVLFAKTLNTLFYKELSL